MTRVDARFPEPLAALLEAAVAEGHFKGPSDAARVATREYFQADSDARLAAVRALVESQPPTGNEIDGALSLAAVVRLTGRLPENLPADLQEYYGVQSGSTEHE